MAKTRYVRADADGAGNGTTYTVGGSNGAWTWAQFLANLPRYGDDYHIKGPFTYTLSADLYLWAGRGNAPIIIEGWDTVPGDTPTGTDRPRIACSAWRFRLGGYNYFKNFRTSHTEWHGCESDSPASVVINCSSVNTGPALDYPAAFSGWGGVWIDCDAAGTDSGWYAQGDIIGCCAHSCDYGIISWGHAYIRGNIIKDCSYGIWLTAGSGEHSFVQDNLFYNIAQKCIDGYEESFGPIMNNIFDSSGDGVSFDAPAGEVVWLDYNNFENLSGSDTVNVSDGDEGTTDDPVIFDAPSDDFRIGPDIKGQGFPKFEWFFRHLFPEDVDSWPDQGPLQRQEIIGETAAVQEASANARSEGSCIKLNPTSTTRPASWVFLIPCTSGQSISSDFWHKVTPGFNGSLDFSASGGGITPIEHVSVPLIDDGSYHQYGSTMMTPTSSGYITVMLQAYDGIVSGDVFIDDITVVV